VHPPIHTIYIEDGVRSAPVTRRVLERKNGDAKVEFVADGREVVRRFEMGRGAQGRGKRSLLLSDFRAEPIKPCPGTPRYLCCRYEILNFATGCPLECAYCILQDYFSNPLLIVQANSDAFLAAAGETLRARPDRFFRLGTGEFTDSLALDPLTGYARLLIEFARGLPNAILELKTKTTSIEGILGIDHGGRVICAWSANSKRVIAEEEFRVASLDDRLGAAAQCETAGYRLAFHFDPIFHYDGWRDDYRRAVERVFERIRPESIAWISLGCFRYRPGLERVIRERFPLSSHTYGEFIRASDGKMRYPQPLRIEMYHQMMQWIRAAGGGDVLVYLCMENARVWRGAMGRAPRNNAELGRWLDAACRD